MNTGVYSSEVKNDSDFEKAKELVAEFAKKEGRQPRIMIAKLGQDGHDRGAKVVATGYADCGFDVDMGPLFQTPEEAAKQAVENDVHVVGVSSLAAGHKTLVPQIVDELKKLGREDIIVVAGGVIPAQDYDALYRAGAAAIFGPGTPVAYAAIKIVEMLMHAFLPSLYDALGIYLALIVVNCIILGRAEMYASKNKVGDSVIDAVGMGIGFTLALFLMASVREILGSGSWFGLPIPVLSSNNISIFTMSPGGFFVFGCLIALVNKLTKGKAIKKKDFSCAACPAAAVCSKGSGKKCEEAEA